MFFEYAEKENKVKTTLQDENKKEKTLLNMHAVEKIKRILSNKDSRKSNITHHDENKETLDKILVFFF